MAEGLGIAASAIAVIELAAKVASLCLQYSKDVQGARDDIARLQRTTTDLQNMSKSVKELLDGPHRERLKASRELRATLDDSQRQLEQLKNKLTPNTPRAAMKRIGLRALKWPFENRDIEKIIESLARFTQTISLSLQVDQT